MPDDVIQSPDTRRAERLPPGQTRTSAWPLRHVGEVPKYDLATWDFAIFPKPLVACITRFSWLEFAALPRVKVFADMHFETGESRLDNFWEGVATRELLKHITLSDAAKFVMVHCEYGVTTNLAIDDFFAEDCLFAMKLDGAELTPEHGYPLRLVVPRLYAWKSAPWVRGIEFMTEDRPGFHECQGYHPRGDPWTEQRRVED